MIESRFIITVQFPDVETRDDALAILHQVLPYMGDNVEAYDYGDKGSGFLPVITEWAIDDDPHCAGCGHVITLHGNDDNSCTVDGCDCDSSKVWYNSYQDF